MTRTLLHSGTPVILSSTGIAGFKINRGVLEEHEQELPLSARLSLWVRTRYHGSRDHGVKEMLDPSKIKSASCRKIAAK